MWSTELQVKNNFTVKMVGTTDYFKGELKLWKTQLMKGVLAHFPSVQSCNSGTFDASVTFCVLVIVKGVWKKV